MQLRLHSLESRGSLWHVHYSLKGIDDDSTFKDRKSEIICRIFCGTLKECIEEAKNKETLIEQYVLGWIKSQKRVMASILNHLPRLRERINLEETVTFQLMHDYGMGGWVVCEITGNEVVWASDVEEYFKESAQSDS